MINTNEIEHFLSNDLVFKIFFTKNKKLLKRLISMSIGIKEDKITKVKILNPILIGDVNSEKVGILDLLVEINNNQKINIEMQRIDKKNFAARIEYYMSKLYIKNLKRGESFSNLNEIYGIYILTYNDKNYQNFYAKIEDYDTMNLQPTKSMKHKIVFNLTKMEEMDKYGFNEEEKELLRLIKCVNKGELDHMSKKSIDIKEAVELLEEINADEELSQMLYYLEKKRLDENTAMYYRKQSEKKLKQSLKKLKDSEIKLKDSENKLKDSETKLKDSENKLKVSENKLKDSENKLKNSENTINILIKSLYNAGKNIEEISNTTNLDIKYVANAINNNLI